MLSQDEMERKLDALSAQNTALQRRISDLEGSVDSHVGIDYGAAQQLSPHPMQQVSVAEYGGGAQRLDSTGVQIASTLLVTSPKIFFLPRFTDTPNDTYPNTYLSGQVVDALAQMVLKSTSPANTAYASLSYATFDENPNAELVCSYGSNTVQARVELVADSTSGRISLRGTVRLVSVTADVSGINDGNIWYRSDLFRFRAYSNGITGNLGMEIQSAAADAIATGGTITTAGVSAARVAPTGAVTGVILAVGTTGGQMCQVVNQSAAGNTVTFAVAATSNVANGVTSVIAGLNARSFVWNSVTALWYPCI